jgi:hypothetical protein
MMLGIAILMVVMHHTAQQGTVIMPHFIGFVEFEH